MRGFEKLWINYFAEPPPGTEVGWRDKNNHSGLYKFFQDLIWKLTGSGKCVQKKDDKPDNPGYSDLTDPNTPVPGEYKDGVFIVKVNQPTTLVCSGIPTKKYLIDEDDDDSVVLLEPEWLYDYNPDPGTISYIGPIEKFLIKIIRPGDFEFSYDYTVMETPGYAIEVEYKTVRVRAIT